MARSTTNEMALEADGYTVSNIDWTVDVPPEVGAVLLATGAGAVQIDAEPEPEPSHMVRVMDEDRTASFSWRRRSYAADDEGVLTIPAAAMADAISHGSMPGADGC